jgi:hypothetical protein
MSKRNPVRLPNSVRMEFFFAVGHVVRAAGFESFPEGGIFTRQEMDRMDEWQEKGKTPEQFAAWLIERRHEEQVRVEAESDLNMGNETISPKDAEIAA